MVAGHPVVAALMLAALVGAFPDSAVYAQGTSPAARGGDAQARRPLRTGPISVPRQLGEELARGGRARVIIGLAVPFAPEGLLQAAERVQQRGEIAAAQNAVATALARFGATGIRRFSVIPAMTATIDGPTLQALAAMPGVAYIEADDLARPTLTQSTQVIGMTSVWASGFTGVGQTIAILDTGVDAAHSFFGGRVVSEACYSTNAPHLTSTCPSGVMEATGPGTAAPCGLSGCDHGTHVAGIAAGNGASFDGVAPGATILAIQVFSNVFDDEFCGPGNSPCIGTAEADQVAALERVYALRDTLDIAAANMSLGGFPYTSPAACDADNLTLKAIIDTLRLAGIATVVAAGNDGLIDAISSPACISTAISVGATTDGSGQLPGDAPADQLYLNTNNAQFLSLLAPGQTIESSIPGSGFAIKEGTSMAAPHVAGAWALLRSHFPHATVTQILNVLASTGTRIPDPGNPSLIKPRINVAAAMSAPEPTCTPALSPSSATFARSGGTGAVRLSIEAGCAWTATDDAPFLRITSARRGEGPATLTYSVGANLGGTRIGTLTIAGETFTVSQAKNVRPMIDFNGDARLDLLWQHQGSGHISAWLMNGLNLIDGTLFTPSQVPDTNWKLQGTGDLDGDGHFDLVWQNIADGRVSAWLMNGLVQRQGTLFSIPQVPDTDWRIRSVGDLNGDGRADLFWQHEGNGSISVWLMNGLTVIDGTLLNPSQVADLDWKIVGTADFDGNGSRDLVWHHQGDGRIAIWFMNGTSQIGGTLTNPGQVPDVNWKIRGVGDLNGDQRPDLLWQNIADGRISVWLMRGLNLIEGTLLNPSEVLDTGWHIVGPR